MWEMRLEILCIEEWKCIRLTLNAWDLTLVQLKSLLFTVRNVFWWDLLIPQSLILENIRSSKNSLSFFSPSSKAHNKSSFTSSETCCPDCRERNCTFAGLKGLQWKSVMHESISCTPSSSDLILVAVFSLWPD